MDNPNIDEALARSIYEDFQEFHKAGQAMISLQSERIEALDTEWAGMPARVAEAFERHGVNEVVTLAMRLICMTFESGAASSLRNSVRAALAEGAMRGTEYLLPPQQLIAGLQEHMAIQKGVYAYLETLCDEQTSRLSSGLLEFKMELDKLELAMQGIEMLLLKRQAG